MDLLKETEHNEINNLVFFASVHGMNCKIILQILIVLLAAIQNFLQTKIIQISKTKIQGFDLCFLTDIILHMNE